MSRHRVAYASPLPPQRSGIADYSAELLPHLGERFDVELLAAPGVRPEAGLTERFAVRPLADLDDPGRRRRYDAVIYQLGNNPRFHGAIYRALRLHPGVVVLHEYVLHHMIRELTLVAGDPAGYLEALRYSAGDSGLALGRRSLATGVPLDPWRYPLFEPAVDAARAVIVHNRTTHRRVLASRPSARVEVVAQPVALHGRGAGDPAAARAALGLPPDVPVVATFGYITAPKRLDLCLAAFARLRRERPRARFLVVGEVDPGAGLGDLLASGLGAGVEVLGHLPMERFLDAMTAADVALNLRYPTAGETSATLLRLLALGRATVVTDAGAFAEIPDGCCAKVPPGPGEEELLAAMLRRLAGDAELRRAMGAAARRHMAAHHSFEAAAGAYAGLVAEVVERGLVPRPAVPPLAPYPPEDLASELARRVGAELADLGIGDADDELLEVPARAIADLGLV